MKFYFLIIVFFFYLNATAFGSERELVGNDIKRLASDLSCNADYQCKSVGYGSRSCGGFDDFIIYSTKSVNVDYMESLSKQYYELDEQYDSQTGGMSICPIEQPRVSACIYNSCVDLGDEPNSITVLHWAVTHNDVDLINQLINQGFDIDKQAGFRGDTALQYAIRMKKTFEMVKLLIDFGAEVNASKFPLEESRNTPLHIAVYTQQYELIKYLIALGANKNAGGKFTPYY